MSINDYFDLSYYFRMILKHKIITVGEYQHEMNNIRDVRTKRSRQIIKNNDNKNTFRIFSSKKIHPKIEIDEFSSHSFLVRENQFEKFKVK